MGWTFMNDPQIGKKELVAHLSSPTYWGSGFRILKQSLVGNNLWVAVERTYDDGTTKRFIALDLLKSGGRDCGWGYKDLQESMGPCEVNCPLVFFDLVPEPDGEYGRAWREEVRAYHAKKKKAATLKGTLTAGEVLPYGGHEYRLDRPRLSRRGRAAGWMVTRVSDGRQFGMTSRQLSEAVTERAECA